LVTGIESPPSRVVVPSCVKVTKWAGVVKDRRMISVLGGGPCVNISCHKYSVNNLKRSILERVYYVKDSVTKEQRPPKLPAPNHFKHCLRRQLHEFRKLLPILEPMTYEQYVDSCEGKKRIVYGNALKSLKLRALHDKDAHVRMFGKFEKTNLTAKPDAVMRAISPRSPRFILSDGRFYKPMEKVICGSIDALYGEPTVMKGKTVDDVGRITHEKWRRYKKPVGLMLDARRFDQHVHQDALKWQHKVQQLCYRGGALREYRNICHKKLVQKCTAVAKDGKIKYVVKGTRTSGDSDTGGGNCLLMSSMIHAFMRSLNINQFSLLNNGDDCVLIFESHLLKLVTRSVNPWFQAMGFEMEVEKPVYEVEKISFCQMQPVLIDGQYRMIRSFPLSIAKDLTSLKPIDKPRVFKSWFQAVADGGVSLTSGIPVLQTFYETLARSAKMVVTARSKSRRIEVRQRKRAESYVNPITQWFSTKDRGHAHVSDSTRFSFYKAFGYTPDAQLALERVYSSMVIPCGSASPYLAPQHHPYYELGPR